jgi:DNA-binding MarR family transcriptional regulator
MTTNLASTGAQAETKEALLAYVDALNLAEPMQVKLWQDAQITLTQLSVLRELRQGPQSTGKLGEKAGLSPTSVTRLVDRLEARGLVRRRRLTEDRRLVEIVLEPAGERLIGQIRVFKGTPVQRAVEGMSDETRRQLIASLRALVDAARTTVREEARD